MTYILHQLMTTVFGEQPLALPGLLTILMLTLCVLDDDAEKLDDDAVNLD